MPDLTLAQGSLTAEITLRPFSLTLRRDGRRLLRNLSAWVADGSASDHFIQFTEGVVTEEELAPHERVARAELHASGTSPRLRALSNDSAQALAVKLMFEGGREGRLVIGLPGDELLTLELSAEDEPLRLAVDWDRRSEEHFVGLGARHCT